MLIHEQGAASNAVGNDVNAQTRKCVNFLLKKQLQEFHAMRNSSLIFYLFRFKLLQSVVSNLQLTGKRKFMIFVVYYKMIFGAFLMARYCQDAELELAAAQLILLITKHAHYSTKKSCAPFRST
jgi:hypothetical protein